MKSTRATQATQELPGELEALSKHISVRKLSTPKFWISAKMSKQLTKEEVARHTKEGDLVSSLGVCHRS